MANIKELNLIEPISSIPYDARLSEVAQKLSSSSGKGLVVLDSTKVVGVVSDRSLRDYGVPGRNAEVSHTSVHSPILKPETPVEEALSYFLDPQFRLLPVVSSGRLVGAVTAAKALGYVKDKPELARMAVGDWVAKPDSWVYENSTVSQARAKMKANGSYHLAIFSLSGKMVGVVSSYDMAIKSLGNVEEAFGGKRGGPAGIKGVGLTEESVTSIATTPFSSLAPKARLSEAAGMMVKGNTSAVAVIDSGKFLGFITIRDVIRSLDGTDDAHVFVFGLGDADKAMAESIRSYARVLCEKWMQKGEVDAIYLHLKSVAEGSKRRYQVKARAVIGQKVFSVSTPERDDHFHNWEAFGAVKEVLDELGRVLSDKVHSKSKRMDNSRTKRSIRDEEEE